MDDPRDRLLDAAMMHVPFDGWSEATLRAAARDADMPREQARALFPRGPVDMALAFHARGDDRMVEALRKEDLSGLRFRDKIARAVRLRIELVADKEAVRRGATLFALPQHAADGTRAIWGTADRIWTELGDTSEDVNWYTKRATLSGVYGSTVLYWLGDDSMGAQDTWGFLDRRIDGVMQFEKFKSAAQSNPVARALMAGPNFALSRLRRPGGLRRARFPGKWSPSR